jgi:hypothetical protein
MRGQTTAHFKGRLAMKIELESEINGAKWIEPKIVSWFAELEIDTVEHDASFNHGFGTEKATKTHVDCINGDITFLDSNGGEVFTVSYEELERDMEDGVVLSPGMCREVVYRIDALISDKF